MWDTDRPESIQNWTAVSWRIYLVARVVAAEVAKCSVHEYVSGDSELAVCFEQYGSWDEQLYRNQLNITC